MSMRAQNNFVVRAPTLMVILIMGSRSLSMNPTSTAHLSNLLGLPTFPKLIVFDLDMCLWRPEMYTLDQIPTASDRVFGQLIKSSTSSEGCIGVKSGYDTIKLFPDALAVLQEYQLDYFPPTTRIAAASSADTPRAVRIGRAAMELIEVLPGVSMRNVFAKGWPKGFEGNMQIGRSPPLSENKAATHFPLLKESCGIHYEEMVFFDDCNWGDHVGNVERSHGVVGQRTPRGLTRSEFNLCLRNFAQKQALKTNVSSD